MAAGKVIVPDGPVDLPRDQTLIVRIEPVGGALNSTKESCLDWLAEHAVDSPGVPADLATNMIITYTAHQRRTPECGGGLLC